MATLRVKKSKDNPFVQIDKRFLENENLSLKAKGLLAYLLSKPDDWKIIVSQLVTTSTDGKSALYSAMKELIEQNYIQRVQERENGKIAEIHYDVYETPHTDFLLPENLKQENLNQENRTLLIMNNTNKENTNKEKMVSFTSEYPQLFEKEEFVKQWERWKLYRREIKKTLTAETIKSQLKFLAEQNNPIATIEQAIRNGWQGLFPIQKGKETPKKFSDFTNIQGGFVIPE